MMNLDKDKIKNVTNASRTATVTMIVLGFRQRAHAFINLASVKRELLSMNERIVDKDYMEFWRGLENAGAGSVILGRRGKQTRFEWNYSLKQIAGIAIEGKEEEVKKIASKRKPPKVVIAPKLPKKAVSEPDKEVKPQGPKREERLVYSIPVRPGFSLDIVLPGDLKEEELKTIRDSLSLGHKTLA